MNPLDEYPSLRRVLYFVQWVVNLVLGSIGVVLLVLDTSPLWYVASAAVFNFVWTYTGLTAQNNVTPKPVQPVEIVNPDALNEGFDEPLEFPQDH